MKNVDSWRPSKFVFKKQQLRASRNRKEVHVGSRLMADLVARQYQDHLKKHAKGKLLDLGCGNVPLFEAYKAYVTDNICVDWPHSPHSNDHLDYECDISRDLPFSHNSFDTVILSDVLEHIPRPEHLVKEVSRVLSPEGKLLMNVPFYYWLHEQPNDYYRYTQFALKRFIKEAGLNLILIEPIGGSPEILTDILAKHFCHIPLLGNPLAMFIQSVTWLAVTTRWGRSISIKTAKLFPFGYFVIARKE